jgi:hypothetical protein
MFVSFVVCLNIGIKRLSYEHDSGNLKKIHNLLTGIPPAVIHRSDGIFISKFIEISRIATIRKRYHVDLLIQNFGLAIWLCPSFKNEISPKAHITLFQLFSDG